MPGEMSAYPVVATLHLRFGSFHVEVTTNSLRVAMRLESYFRPYAAESPSQPHVRLRAIVGDAMYDAARLRPWGHAATSARPPKDSFYDEAGVRFILKNRTGLLIALRRRSATITGDLERHSNQVVNLIATLFGISLLDQGYVMLHASAVVDIASAEAMIFLGNSGSGKSSLALQLIERGGYDFLSNDRVLLRVGGEQVEVIGLPTKPRVNPGTLLASDALSRLLPRPRLRAYRRLSPEDLWRLEEKHEVDVERTLGAGRRLGAPLRRAYRLEWRRDGVGLDMQELDPAAAVAAMRATAKDFGPFDLHLGTRSAEREFDAIAARVPFVRVKGKVDPAGFANVVASMRDPERRRLTRSGGNSGGSRG